MYEIKDIINKVHCADCLEFMKEIPDKSIDLVITDPPYGINVASNGKVGGGKLAMVTNWGIQEWDKNIPTKEVFLEMFRVSKNQIIFGGNYMVECLYNSPCWLVWDKDNTGNFADCELIWTSFKTAVRKFKWRWNGMLQEDMSNKENRFHPTQKPIKLMEWIIFNYSQENDLILDPFAGGGSTLVACKNSKRNFIGIEIEPKYVKICNDRLRQDLLF
jgi:site-specific DNA-methyltransferase (adenine-specific)